MDVRLLEAFRAVVELGSVTAAARRLNVTQPAVSAQIARLEAEAGFKLFDRTGGRLVTTADGQAFLADVDFALETLGGLTRSAARIRRGRAGSLVVAAHPSAGISLLPPVIARFAAARPEARVQLLTRNSEVVRRLFPSRHYDLGVVEAPVDPTGLTVLRRRMECVAILPKDHPLAAHDVITPARLASAPFLSISRERPTHHRVLAAFAEADVPCAPVAEAEFFASLCTMVAHGLGVSVVDPASAEAFAPLGLAVRPFEPAIPYEIAVFHASDRAPSALALDFLAALDERLAALPRFTEDHAS